MTIDQKTPSAPHDCPNCGEPSYLGLGVPGQCTNRECPFWSEDCWVKHVLELPDDEEGVEFEIEDEPTIPFLKFPSLTDLLNIHPDTPTLSPNQLARLRVAMHNVRGSIAKVDKDIDTMPVPFVLTPKK